MISLIQSTKKCDTHTSHTQTLKTMNREIHQFNIYFAMNQHQTLVMVGRHSGRQEYVFIYSFCAYFTFLQRKLCPYFIWREFNSHTNLRLNNRKNWEDYRDLMLTRFSSVLFHMEWHTCQLHISCISLSLDRQEK